MSFMGTGLIQRNEKFLKNSVLKKIARMASEEKQEVK